MNTILEWNQESVWIGTRNGISVYDPSADTFQDICVLPLLSRNSENANSDITMEDNILVMTYDDKNKRIWIGKPNGLSCYDIQTQQWLETSSSDKDALCKRNIRSIALNGDKLWQGTLPGLVEYSIPDNGWHEHRAFTSHEPLRKYSVSNIEFDGDYVWFSNWSGSHNGAIIRFDRCTNTWQSYGRETILKDMKAESMNEVFRSLWIKMQSGL